MKVAVGAHLEVETQPLNTSNCVQSMLRHSAMLWAKARRASDRTCRISFFIEKTHGGQRRTDKHKIQKFVCIHEEHVMHGGQHRTDKQMGVPPLCNL